MICLYGLEYSLVCVFTSTQKSKFLPEFLYKVEWETFLEVL